MKIKALHKGKWHDVKDITKCDDGVEYQLEGINGKTYAKDIKDLDLDKGEVTNPDGSVTRFPGKEQLKKPLAKGINLMDKWALLKARLNHKNAFQDMDIFTDDDEEADDDRADGSTDADSAGSIPGGPGGQERAGYDQDPNSPGGDQAGVPQEDPRGLLRDDGRGGADQEADRPVQDNEGLQQPDAASEEGPGEPTDNAEQSGDLPPLEGEELQEALKEIGYSDTEIAYILHGHSPAIPSPEELKAQQSQQNMSQDQEGHHLTLDQRTEEHDVDLDHKKKMHELELEYAKREKELKLKHLEEELAIRRDKMKSKDSSGGAK